MTKFSCKDCKHYIPNCVCDYERICPYDDMPICAHFEAKDGSRPRFCRLASSVDEMAEALVVPMCSDGSLHNFVHGPLDYVDREDAIREAIKWLMEVEE